MTVTQERLVCGWCNAQNPTGETSCTRCGAPLSVADTITEAGWRSAPKVRDTTTFNFSNSTAEVEGETVPSVSITLGSGDWIYFEADALLWKDATLQWHDDGYSRSNASGGTRSLLSPLMTVTGPGRISLARDSAGELVVLPVEPGVEIDVREYAFIAASHALGYQFQKLDGIGSILHGIGSMFVERFTASDEPGLLMVHGSGNVFERTLGAGETLLVEPGGFLYKDSSVTTQSFKVDFKAHKIGANVHLMKLTGPGRVGIQSMYHPHIDKEEE